jgi:hypothetical protein
LRRPHGGEWDREQQAAHHHRTDHDDRADAERSGLEQVRGDVEGDPAEPHRALEQRKDQPRRERELGRLLRRHPLLDDGRGRVEEARGQRENDGQGHDAP